MGLRFCADGVSSILLSEQSKTKGSLLLRCFKRYMVGPLIAICRLVLVAPVILWLVLVDGISVLVMRLFRFILVLSLSRAKGHNVNCFIQILFNFLASCCYLF